MDGSTKSSESKASVLNLPNALTVLRIFLVPVFIYLYLQDTTGAQWLALGVFCVASFTDYLDGQIARARNLVTDFGRLADPLADKALTLSAFFLLAIRGPLPSGWFWIFTVLVAIREIGITLLREVLRRKGIVVSASSGGKLKTVFQIGLITLMLVPWSTFIASEVVNNILIWAMAALAVATLTLTLVSGWQYCIAVWQGSQKNAATK